MTKLQLGSAVQSSSCPTPMATKAAGCFSLVTLPQEAPGRAKGSPSPGGAAVNPAAAMAAFVVSATFNIPSEVAVYLAAVSLS